MHGFVPCELVIWGPFVHNIPVFFVCLAFGYYIFVCLEFCVSRTSSGPLYIMCLVVFAEVAVFSSSLCYYSTSTSWPVGGGRWYTKAFLQPQLIF